jgi:intergrase/recombinase
MNNWSMYPKSKVKSKRNPKVFKNYIASVYKIDEESAETVRKVYKIKKQHGVSLTEAYDIYNKQTGENND